MIERKKKCSMNSEHMKVSELDSLRSDKSLEQFDERYSQSSTRVTSRKQSKISFFSSVKPKIITGFFGFSTKKTWIEDKPAPESVGEYYEKRKQIIFQKLKIKENEKEILKLILMSQNKANELIKGSGFFYLPHQIHEWSIALKENIANYGLVLQLYLNSKQINKANELFLLMDQQNKELMASIALNIKKNFKNMTNGNRIGKFYPSIIKIFFQILSVVIKFAAKFNKNLIENFYLKMYIETIYDVKETIINRFTSINNDFENDFKLMGRFFYYNAAYNMSIYFLYRYQPLNIVVSLFQFILEHYHGKDTSYIINSEHLLLLKLYYNLGILYYTDGNNIEAISNLNLAKVRLLEISSFPFTILNDNYNPAYNNAPISTNKSNTNNYSNNYIDRTSISSFNIDENVDKYVTGTHVKKRSISSRVGRDMMIPERTFEPTKRVCSNILFGKDKFIFKEQVKYINECISQKILVEIELLLAEIELDQKNFKQSFMHINKILDGVRQTQKLHVKDKIIPQKKGLNVDTPVLNNLVLKLADYKKASYSNNVVTHALNMPKIQFIQCISETNKKHISYILEEIEHEYKKRNEYGNSNNDLNNSLYDDNNKSAVTDRYDYDKRLNENIKRENKISLETEKFFIFICGLSLYQLKVLNEFQPEPSKKRDDLPILFPNQFKDCLTFSQRLALNNLDTMSLSRYIILKDSNKDISPENLDYVFLTRKIKSSHKDKNSDLNSDKNSNEYFYEFAKKISKTVSDESSGESNENQIDTSSKSNLFDKLRFKQFVEEDKIFNQKITEITKKDNKSFLEMNRNRILKILHSLKPKEKELLMNSSKCFNDFLKKIEKKMSKKRLISV